MMDNVKFLLHVIVHPFDGFWDLKHEKKGSLILSSILVFITACVFQIRDLHTGFLFNYNNLQLVNIFNNLRNVIIILVLWCAGNWSVTTLMDGKGKLADIYMTLCYSLTPLILIQLPLVMLSNIFILEEGAYIHVLNGISYFWFVFLLFFGTMTIHEFTLGKAVLTVFVTLISIGIILFLTFLLFNMTQQIIAFVYSIAKEVMLRVG